MNKRKAVGRFVEIIMLLAVGSLIFFGFSLEKWNSFSFASIVFLAGGALFEAGIRRRISTKSQSFSRDSFKLAFCYIHYMAFFQKNYGDMYDFSDDWELRTNVIAYFFVLMYVVVVFGLFQDLGKISLVIYALPAVSNIYSLIKDA